MLILLPPSETKRGGGDPALPLDLAGLSRPALGSARRSALARVAELSRNLRTAATALGLGERNAAEAALNREIRRGPTMPAIERFDGVLFEALDALDLDRAARGWLDRNVAIASALFGLVAPEDRIPTYRLSAGTRLPGTTLRAIWRRPLGAELAAASGFVLDLRSEAYVALGPAPAGSVFLRVVTGESGAVRALNHFNKAAKGKFVRRLALDRPSISGVADLETWAATAGLRLTPGVPGELNLVVPTPG
ncbi:MAG: peroxide stress protein YaaA [Micrococcales bacterium]|nr:peroxide stress protein YaaA [Micrococcales bacterium]